MNINSLYGSLGSSAVASVGSTNAVGSPSPSNPPVGAAGTASISSPAQFFSEMQQLSQQNPTEFKSVAAQVATTFQNAASQASGPEAQFLNGLASQFSQAAQTGTLQAPGAQGTQAAAATQASGTSGAHHHHHHHHGGASMSSGVEQAFQSATSLLDQALQGTSSSTSAVSSST